MAPTPDENTSTGTKVGIGRASDDEAETVRVVFTPSGLNGSVAAGSTVLDAARALGADLDSVCGGRGICGRCQISVSTGEFPKWALSVGDDHVSRPEALENDYRGKRPLGEGQRLGCGTRVLGDVVVDIPAESQIHKQVVRKAANVDGLIVDPLLSLHFLKLGDNDEGDSCTSLISTQLAQDWQINNVDFDTGLLPHLHRITDDPPRG